MKVTELINVLQKENSDDLVGIRLGNTLYDVEIEYDDDYTNIIHLMPSIENYKSNQGVASAIKEHANVLEKRMNVKTKSSVSEDEKNLLGGY